LVRWTIVGVVLLIAIAIGVVIVRRRDAAPRLRWIVRASVSEARAEIGGLWLGLATTVFILAIPVVAITGLKWGQGLEVALLTALVTYPVTLAFATLRKVVEHYRHGDRHFQTQVEIKDGKATVWLSLKDGSPPQGVNELALSVRRRGDKWGYRVILVGAEGTRTIDRAGFPPPHALYPDQFGPDAPPLQAGRYQFIWSDVRRGKRREFLFSEEEVTP
jgi:hypothetical protein